MIRIGVHFADNTHFLRTLRQLRDLRRYSPVTINNPQQVNIAAEGGQQINAMNKGNESIDSLAISRIDGKVSPS